MKIAATFLCDAASVREGLLNVLGGGVNIVRRESFPAPLGVNLALMAEAEPGTDDHTRPQDFTIEVKTRGGETQSLARIEGGWQADLNDDIQPDPELSSYIPIIVPLFQVALPRPGLYEITIDIKGLDTHVIVFKVVGPSASS